jgi:hypothetical protein
MIQSMMIKDNGDMSIALIDDCSADDDDDVW